MKKSLGKRIVSGVTSALLAASAFAQSIPLGNSGLLKARAATNLGGNSEVDDVTLLVGSNPRDPDGNPYGTFASVDAAVAQYEKDYLLGIAGRFCVFVAENFEVENCDAEGRVAIGGSFFTPGNGYEIGNGDYVNKDSVLDKLLDNSDYAHVIVNGESAKNLRPTSWEKRDGNYVSKRFWISNSTQIDGPDKDYLNYCDAVKDGTYTGTYEDYFYKDSSVFDVAAQVEKIKDISTALAEKENQFSVNFEGETLTLTYSGDEQDTVYCNLTDEEQELFKKAKYIKYENIPNLSSPRKVVGSDCTEKEWKYAYIVINIGGESVTVANNDVYTFINGTLIGKNVYSNDKINLPANEGDMVPGFEDYTNNVVYNNHYGVTSLLYNYYQATDVALGKNFQGTILAPNADVHDGNNGYGHLSGALVAKSFKGSTEFGYRPFMGPSSMLGLESNYTIDLYKLDDETGLLLDGATFGLFPVTTKDGKNEVATEPSIEVQVKNGKITTEIPVGRYVLKEIKAPTDYALDNETSYYIEVTENEKNRM